MHKDAFEPEFCGRKPFIMTTTILTAPAKSVSFSDAKGSPIARFFKWAATQEENRLLWLGIALAGHGCILTPLTVFAVILAGTNIALFLTAIVAMTMALVTNLAAMPTK